MYGCVLSLNVVFGDKTGISVHGCLLFLWVVTDYHGRRLFRTTASVIGRQNILSGWLFYVSGRELLALVGD